MKQAITGRTEEIKILEQLLKSDQPELLAIYGRRRVGKTYLVKNYYADNLIFSCSGESGGSVFVSPLIITTIFSFEINSLVVMA